MHACKITNMQGTSTSEHVQKRGYTSFFSPPGALNPVCCNFKLCYI